MITMHYGTRAMGAMPLRISELCLPFSPHQNIADGDFNLVHHFFRMQIFQINEKGAPGPVELRPDEEGGGESES